MLVGGGLVTDILDLIDGAIEDWSTSGDAMRWSPDPAPAETRRLQTSPFTWAAGDTVRHAGRYRCEPPAGFGYASTSSARRERVIDQPRPGMRLVPFVGGPWHGDLRAIPPTEYVWNVMDPPEVPLMFWEVESPLLTTPGYTSYTVTRAWLNFPPCSVPDVPAGWEGRIEAARAPGTTDDDLMEVVWELLAAGWHPWPPLVLSDAARPHSGGPVIRPG